MVSHELRVYLGGNSNSTLSAYMIPKENLNGFGQNYLIMLHFMMKGAFLVTTSNIYESVAFVCNSVTFLVYDKIYTSGKCGKYCLNIVAGISFSWSISFRLYLISFYTKYFILLALFNDLVNYFCEINENFRRISITTVIILHLFIL